MIGSTATLLRQVARGTDLLARLGGDEFALILPEATERDAEALAARILTGSRALARSDGQPGGAQVTASIGVTAFDATTGLTGPELVVEADIAMYDAKSLGRNRYAMYDRSTGRRQTRMPKRHPPAR